MSTIKGRKVKGKHDEKEITNNCDIKIPVINISLKQNDMIFIHSNFIMCSVNDLIKSH